MSQSQKTAQFNALQHAYDTIDRLLKTKTVATFAEIQAGLNALEFVGRTVNTLLNKNAEQDQPRDARGDEYPPAPTEPSTVEPPAGADA